MTVAIHKALLCAYDIYKEEDRLAALRWFMMNLLCYNHSDSLFPLFHRTIESFLSEGHHIKIIYKSCQNIKFITEPTFFEGNFHLFLKCAKKNPYHHVINKIE